MLVDSVVFLECMVTACLHKALSKVFVMRVCMVTGCLIVKCKVIAVAIYWVFELLV